MFFSYRFKNFTKIYVYKILHFPISKTSEFIGNKIADAVTKSKDENIEKQEPVEGTIISPGKREEILNKLRKVL